MWPLSRFIPSGIFSLNVRFFFTFHGNVWKTLRDFYLLFEMPFQRPHLFKEHFHQTNEEFAHNRLHWKKNANTLRPLTLFGHRNGNLLQDQFSFTWHKSVMISSFVWRMVVKRLCLQYTLFLFIHLCFYCFVWLLRMWTWPCRIVGGSIQFSVNRILWVHLPEHIGLFL